VLGGEEAVTLHVWRKWQVTPEIGQQAQRDSNVQEASEQPHGHGEAFLSVV
jgi:hypothetical protein